jgi:hypothetical protein
MITLVGSTKQKFSFWNKIGKKFYYIDPKL